jgi:hypothetical protein
MSDINTDDYAELVLGWVSDVVQDVRHTLIPRSMQTAEISRRLASGLTEETPGFIGEAFSAEQRSIYLARWIEILTRELAACKAAVTTAQASRAETLGRPASE